MKSCMASRTLSASSPSSFASAADGSDDGCEPSVGRVASIAFCSLRLGHAELLGQSAEIRPLALGLARRGLVRRPPADEDDVAACSPQPARPSAATEPNTATRVNVRFFMG